jgi:hypothetical protein
MKYFTVGTKPFSRTHSLYVIFQAHRALENIYLTRRAQLVWISSFLHSIRHEHSLNTCHYFCSFVRSVLYFFLSSRLSEFPDYIFTRLYFSTSNIINSIYTPTQLHDCEQQRYISGAHQYMLKKYFLFN